MMTAPVNLSLFTRASAVARNCTCRCVNARKSTVMHAAVSFTLQNSTQAEVCSVVQFLADKGADLDDEDVNGRTPMMLANILPIDTAVTLLNKLITDSGATPRHPAKR